MYTEQIPKYGDLMTIQDFIENCEWGGLMDCDGYGYPVKNNLMNDQLNIYPSQRILIPKDATHIMWFNK